MRETHNQRVRTTQRMVPIGGPEISRYIAARLVGKAGARGLSSEAMIAVALLYKDGLPEGYEGDYPRDLGDLGRCYEAFVEAPSALRERMLPILAEWTNALLIQQLEVAA